MALSESCKTQHSKDQGSVQSPPSDVIELNVGGQVYYTRHATLTSVPNSLLGKLFSNKKGSANDLSRDLRGRYFIDRDGFLFRYVLDYLRDKQVVLPDHFPERGRLKKEAEYFQLPDLAKLLSTDESNIFPDDFYYSDFDDGSLGSDQRFYSSYSLDRRYGYITVGFKGICATGGKESVDKAKKVPRIFISGRIGLTKEVFGDALNENRALDRPPDRYTSRFFLKFRHLERAFDMLSENGFHIVASNSSLTSTSFRHYADDRVWSNCTHYVFYRGPSRWSSSHCDCCCKSHKSEREGESGTSFNELSTSCSESQSEASSPQGTVICSPAARPPHNIKTLDHAMKKRPSQAVPQHAEVKRKTDALRMRTFGVREREAAKRKANKEKMTPEQELEKCIQDFRRIRIPERFPERKNMWQSELLRKYPL